VDEAKNTLTRPVAGSITRERLVGKDLTRASQLTADGHLIIRAADRKEHWSVTSEHY
jgi:hypothetical protein